MTNSEAQSYAIIALDNLIKAGMLNTSSPRKALQALDHELHVLFDQLSEEEAEDIAEKRLLSRP